MIEVMPNYPVKTVLEAIELLETSAFWAPSKVLEDEKVLLMVAGECRRFSKHKNIWRPLHRVNA
jgi:hypothetical protein